VDISLQKNKMQMRIPTSFKLPTGILTVILISASMLSSATSKAQSLQTIRGQIVDGVSNQPLVGVSVILLDPNAPPVGSMTDADGNYRIPNVVVGRHTLQVTYIGYEVQTVPNVVVTAGKEIVLNLSLSESINQLEEITVVGDARDDKTATNNELAIVSARSFNVDDTKRYAGSIGDPSRMAANFAGVVGGNDSRNDLVVRGNSSLGMLWQLEGLNIPNPNHFGSLASTGGPISILNNNNLDKSDFMTSAFPAQYGNAVAGVFDLTLRDGNNEKSEFMGQVGFNGFEFGAEGPFSKKSKASYIINGRYSTLGVFSALGIDFGTGSATPTYQDVNLKINLPTKHGGTWSLFALGGSSKIDLLGSEADLKNNKNLYGSENDDSFPRYKTSIVGASYEKNISPKTFAKFTAGLSRTYEQFRADSLVRDASTEVIARHLRVESRSSTLKYSFNFQTRTKINAKNSLTSGFYVDATRVELFQHDFFANSGRDSVRYDIDNNTTLYQAYSTWKHRFSQKVSAQVGLHAQYYDLNKQFVPEPRVGALYVINEKHSIAAGYGMHSQIQSYYTSFLQTETTTGEIIYTNTDLEFTRSNHFVLTYDWNISEKLRLKAETYYQNLSNVPVEQRRSSFSILNTGSSFGLDAKDSLTNLGTGRNYGIELTAERFFNDGYYFLVTASLFNSKYKGSDGIQRNTAFNTNYVFNALAGKEWSLTANKSKFLSVNLKFSTVGGRYLTPLNVQESQQMGRPVYYENEAYSYRQTPYFRIDLRISYRKEFKKSTLESSIDFQNLTNQKNIFMQSFNPRTGTVITQYQQGFFPVPYVRFTF
jgi:hypothetical protein